MDRKELTKRYREETSCTWDEAHNAVDTVLNLMITACETGEGMNIYGLGQTEYRNMEPRKSRNPRTGEQLVAPAHVKIVFNLSKNIKDAAKKSK